MYILNILNSIHKNNNLRYLFYLIMNLFNCIVKNIVSFKCSWAMRKIQVSLCANDHCICYFIGYLYQATLRYFGKVFLDEFFTYIDLG